MYILSTVGVVFVGRLVCSVNVLYMELSYTGSLDQSRGGSRGGGAEGARAPPPPHGHIHSIMHAHT